MLTIRELDLPRPAGGTLHAYDTGGDGFPVLWHGGTPNIGQPPVPLLADAERLGLRLVGADRPGYGGTTRDPEAPIAAVAADAAALADHLGLGSFATLGHSGGGPRALATAALLPDRVVAAVAVSSPAPPDAGFDRSDGMAAGVVHEQEAALAGRQALTALLAADEFDEGSFTPADHQALQGAWSWFGPIVQAATAGGVDGQVDDLLAQARPWGFDPTAIGVPVLVVHGMEDRVVPASHGRWLAARVPGAELHLVPGAGHISVLEQGRWILEALRAHAERPR